MISVQGSDFGPKGPELVKISPPPSRHGGGSADSAVEFNCHTVRVKQRHTWFECVVGNGWGRDNVLHAYVQGQKSNSVPFHYARPILDGFQSSISEAASVTVSRRRRRRMDSTSAKAVLELVKNRVDARGDAITFERVFNIPFSSLNATGAGCRRKETEGCQNSILNGNNARVIIISNVSTNKTISLSCLEPPGVERTWVEQSDDDRTRDVADVSGKVSVLTCEFPPGVVGPVEVRLEVHGGLSSDAYRLERVCRGDQYAIVGDDQVRVLDRGFYGGPGRNCTRCPRHTSCTVGAPSPIAQNGYWGKENPDGSWSVMSCTPESACMANNTCAVGYQDERCSKCCNGTKGAAFSQCIDDQTGNYAKFYRPPNVAECVQCPDLAWLFILAYVLAAIFCALFLLWLTQKREINFAGMRIAVDYYQVLSMFAGLKVKWPNELRVLWRAASTANLDPDITAPGCSIDVTYEMKWYLTETVPLGMIFCLLFFASLIMLRAKLCGSAEGKTVRHNHKHKKHDDHDEPRSTNPLWGAGSNEGRSKTTKRSGSSGHMSVEMAAMNNASAADEEKCDSQQLPQQQQQQQQQQQTEAARPSKNKKSKDLTDIVPGLIGGCVSIMYYLYLLLVRGSFEIFDCETIGYAVGKDGVNHTVKALATDGSIECGTAEHNALLFPATAAMLVYGMGIPLFFGTVLWHYRRLIVVDQNLRRLGEGYSFETNPAYEVRRKYQRIYQHFRPHAP